MEQVPRTDSSFVTETLRPLNSNFPFSLFPPGPTPTALLAVSLTVVDTSRKRYHVAFALRLADFT